MPVDMSSVKKAPKWAWYAVGGIGGGIMVIKIWQGRAKPEEEKTTETAVVDPGYTAAGEYVGPGASPVATVTPSVVIAGGGGGEQSMFDPSPYLGFLSDGFSQIVGGYSGIYAPIAQTNNDIVHGLFDLNQASVRAGEGNNQRALESAISAIANGGSSPSPVAQNPIPAAIAAPSVAAPAPKAAGPKVEYQNRERDNGLSGAKRKTWCNRVTIHRYPDGRAVVVNEVKIKDGGC